MRSDIEIARSVEMKNIADVASEYGIGFDDLEMYGKYKAKLSEEFLKSRKENKKGKLVLVTAINPTPAGEGKTTTLVGLGQSFKQLGKKAVIALREPSLGPCFGIKGGAAGGGLSQVVPMDELNLHFTGDFHAITSANNLLAAMLDNHIQQGNALGIDTNAIIHKRCNDMNDLKERLSNIIVAYNFNGEPVFAKDLKAVGAMAALLKDAIKPNIVQTLEHSLALVHGGPFANIAHGCNSVRATKIAMGMADIALTEAGFGADLGAEKFFDIKCRKAGIAPDCVVLVATVRALKYNGGVAKDELSKENLEALKKGIVNLEKHIENIKLFGVPVVVTLNHFVTDSEAEVNFIKEFCESRNCEFAISKVWEEGGKGGVELAKKILYTLENKESHFAPLYPDDMSIEDKLYPIATKIYGAKNVTYSPAAKKAIEKAKALGYGNLPVCVAKNQYSLSDDPKKLGRPENFDINVREAYVNAGAGFVVAVTGSIMTMPGLPKVPAAEAVDVDENGNIVGLF